MSQIKAFLFDQDGVIVDTERDGHRVAFNRTFAEFGFDVQWSVEQYHRLLQVGGGKERMMHYLQTQGFGVEVKPEDVPDLIRRLHQRKTDLFIELIESGTLPLRPGVRRMMEEADRLGIMLGICTTSNERSARAISQGLLAGIPFQFVLAGDVVPAKKPDPAIYRLASQRSGLQADQCVVFEDSHVGAVAAKAAGMHVVATTTRYTENEDLSMADVIVDCLGELDGPRTNVRPGARSPVLADGCVHACDVLEWFCSEETNP
jgi:HAD superfamily hydrolase (TIGR01509 family)